MREAYSDGEPQDERSQNQSSQEQEDYGDDAPIAQGDSSTSDVPEDISPGDEMVMINADIGDLIDLSDIEEMEAYAAIVNTGGSNLLVDSDVEEHASNSMDGDDILADFNDRMQVVGGSERLMDALVNHTSLSPEISGNDVDAAWQDSDQSGEEGVGGSVPTPDQDVVEELGQALGIQYDDFEPLNTEDKLAARDEHRWELNPDSRDEYQRLGDDSEDGDAGDSGSTLDEEKYSASIQDEDI